MSCNRAVGIRQHSRDALILDVLDDGDFDKRKAFYLKLGFAEIGNGDPTRLFLSMKNARAEFRSRLKNVD